MSTVTITTNHHWRDFVYRSDVPAAVLADRFDHLDADDATDGFFCYRGWWYHVSDFMALNTTSEPAEGLADADALHRWQGYHADSYFSGVVIKISRDSERYQVGTYMS